MENEEIEIVPSPDGNFLVLGGVELCWVGSPSADPEADWAAVNLYDSGK